MDINLITSKWIKVFLAFVRFIAIDPQIAAIYF